MLITTHVELDFQRPANPVTVNVVQGDRNSRCVQVALYSGGEHWKIPEDVRVAVRYRKPDATGGHYDTMPDGTAAWHTESNMVTILLAPQMLTVSGTVLAQLELIQDDSSLGSFTLYVRVEPDPSAGVLKSEDYVNILEWMENQLDDRLNSALESGAFTGPEGKAGEAAVLESATVTYQVGESGTEVPVGEWLSYISAAEQGGYLWTRTVYTFNTGDPVTQYSVSSLGGSSPGVQKKSAVLLASDWSSFAPYTQSIAVDGLTDTVFAWVYVDIPDDVAMEAALQEEAAKISSCRRSGNQMTFRCLKEKPELDINIILEVYV